MPMPSKASIGSDFIITPILNEVKENTSSQKLVPIRQCYHKCEIDPMASQSLQHKGDRLGKMVASLSGVRYHLWRFFF